MRRLYYRKLCRLVGLLLMVAGMGYQADAQSTVTGRVNSAEGGEVTIVFFNGITAEDKVRNFYR